MLVPWLGWIALIITVTEFFTYLARKCRLKHLKHFRGQHHRSWGKLLLLLALLHGLLAGALLTLNWGTLCFLSFAALYATYHFRQKLGPRWLKLHRSLSLAAAALAALHIISKLR